ncbi:MAG: J domain-containing protein [Actinomycetota bacterium]|nr:J domain-containing protein [Actinomycetota bacterium]
MSPKSPSLYEQLGVARDATRTSVQRAYRRKALRHHPDHQTGNAETMSDLNNAWFVLSDATRRAAYDKTLGPPPSQHHAPNKTFQAKPKNRKTAWFDGLKLQATRLGREAGLSASQALAIRHRVRRLEYEIIAEEIVKSFGERTEERVRLARDAGAAPLDLALAAALIGLHEFSVRFLRASTSGDTDIDNTIIRTARLIDRMWDNLAHGVSWELETALGGNPRTLRSLTGRRV